MDNRLPVDELLKNNVYPGRGIIVGKTEDGTHAVFAYFIMGRSANSRNRIFVKKEDGVYTEPFDASKVEDPSLIIYRAVGSCENKVVVTNGDQTDTILSGFKDGKTFKEALESREFEPDAPNYTPRISAALTFEEGDFSYEISILKSNDEEGSGCARYTFSYPSKAGLGHLIHTYEQDGNPLPTFKGEPKRVLLKNCMEGFAKKLWESLNEDNKISLYVRFTDLASGEVKEKLFNKNE